MRNKKKIKIKYKKERAILSDVLPYELPISFSNRHFYRFLVSYGIDIKDSKVSINDKGFQKYSQDKREVIYDLVKLIFGCDNNEPFTGNTINIGKNAWRKPFIYKISHKEADFRELAVIHPKSQVELVELYEKSKELILYYSSISNFSLRRPNSIAKYVYYKDKLHRVLKGDPKDKVEDFQREYENLRTFFAYKEYSNIFRFYEDSKYQRAEKRFQHMVKFDISKCFDSIYTHSIVWALYNKNIVKNNLGWSENTFAGEFDKFMQKINYGETNGILIGPEFSRIFAELILQQIDKTVESKLKAESIYINKNYECYRYVDDYFLFYNNIGERDHIMDAFKHELKEYKMSINDAKTIYFDKPIITDITMAKFKIIDLLDDSIKFKVEELETELIADNAVEIDAAITDKFSIYINPNKFIAKYKSIIKGSNVQYKDVINYTLAGTLKKIESVIKKVDDKMREYAKLNFETILDKKSQKRKYNLERLFTTFIINILDFVFFIYTVNPKVNSTIKLSLILNQVMKFVSGKHYFENIEIAGVKQRKSVNRFDKINKDLVFKKIEDDVRLVLEKNKIAPHSQVETLYLLIILKELGREYMLPESMLLDYFSISKKDNELDFKCFEDMNVISIMVLLSYVENDIKYNNVKQSICKCIEQKICEKEPDKRRRDAELTILILDSLSCPYLEFEFKKKLLTLFQITNIKRQKSIIDYCCIKQRFWFTKWGKLNLTKELNAKISAEVYS